MQNGTATFVGVALYGNRTVRVNSNQRPYIANIAGTNGATVTTANGVATVGVDTSVVQEKLYAGDGIDITGSTISCTVTPGSDCNLITYDLDEYLALTTDERKVVFQE